MTRNGNNNFDLTRPEPGQKKSRSWKTKAAFAVGLGIPIGLTLAADPAAAYPSDRAGTSGENNTVTTSDGDGRGGTGGGPVDDDSSRHNRRGSDRSSNKAKEDFGGNKQQEDQRPATSRVTTNESNAKLSTGATDKNSRDATERTEYVSLRSVDPVLASVNAKSLPDFEGWTVAAPASSDFSPSDDEREQVDYVTRRAVNPDPDPVLENLNAKAEAERVPGFDFWSRKPSGEQIEAEKAQALKDGSELAGRFLNEASMALEAQEVARRDLTALAAGQWDLLEKYGFGDGEKAESTNIALGTFDPLEGPATTGGVEARKAIIINGVSYPIFDIAKEGEPRDSSGWIEQADGSSYFTLTVPQESGGEYRALYEAPSDPDMAEPERVNAELMTPSEDGELVAPLDHANRPLGYKLKTGYGTLELADDQETPLNGLLAKPTNMGTRVVRYVDGKKSVALKTTDGAGVEKLAFIDEAGTAHGYQLGKSGGSFTRHDKDDNLISTSQLLPQGKRSSSGGANEYEVTATNGGITYERHVAWGGQFLIEIRNERGGEPVGTRIEPRF